MVDDKPKRRLSEAEKPKERTKSDVAFLNSLPQCYCEKRIGTVFGMSGLDIHGCIGGRTFVIEKKKIGHKPTDRQLSRMRVWERAGAITGWYTTREELIDIFEVNGIEITGHAWIYSNGVIDERL